MFTRILLLFGTALLLIACSGDSDAVSSNGEETATSAPVSDAETSENQTSDTGSSEATPAGGEFEPDWRFESGDITVVTDDQGQQFLAVGNSWPSSPSCPSSIGQAPYVFIEGDGTVTGEFQGLELGTPACGVPFDSVVDDSDGKMTRACESTGGSIKTLRPPIAGYQDGQITRTVDMACIELIP